MKYLFLHGLGQTNSSFDATIKEFDHANNTLVPNLNTLNVYDELSFENLYKSLDKYILDINEPLNICGLSLGAVLAINYAILNPKKVNSLVLIGAQFKMPKNLLKIQNIIFKFIRKNTFEKIGYTKKDFISLTKSIMNLDFSKDLEKITCPVLIICGEKDIANKKASLQLNEKLLNSKLILIKDTKHEVNIESPKELAKHLNMFYDKEIK